MNIFDYALQANAEGIQQCLHAGIDPCATNDKGLTALHCVAIAFNRYAPEQVIPCLQLLIDAGADLNVTTSDGRSVLYLAAEFSQSLEGVKFLVAQGCEANVFDSHGNHIVINACADEVQNYLSQLTGFPVPAPEPILPNIKLSAADWKQIKAQLDIVFKQLETQQIIVLQDAGETQEDGFADCTEIYHKQGAEKSSIEGFCFYTRQDQNRAKRTAKLPLSFIATDETAKTAVLIGLRIKQAFEQQGFIVCWNSSANIRPEIYLIRRVMV